MRQPGESPLRILHAPRNIAGQAGDTVAALRRLGHEAELWETQRDPFGRPADRHLELDPGDARATVAAVLEAADRFDVVHFHFARSLVPSRGVLPPFWDLPVLRGLGRRVFFTFHGSDVRIDRLHRELNPWSSDFVPAAPVDDDRTAKSVQVIRTYADRMFVVSVNYLAYVPDAEYLPRVIDLASWPEVAPRVRERPVIVHAPTRRSTKGTELLLPALDTLRAEGLEFDLRLLEGLPHQAVREAVAGADILVDNLVGGSYGIVSLEAMASSAVAVSNATEAVRRAHTDSPVVHVDPGSARDVLRALIRDSGRRRTLAEQGRPFVARTHDAGMVARRLVDAYRAPARAPGERLMPDWTSLRGARRLEELEARVAELEVELARGRHREADLRARLGLPGGEPPSPLRRVARRIVPHAARRRLTGR